MSEGELLQMEKTRNLNFDESVYYDIIHGKLLVCLHRAALQGPSSVTKDPEQIQKMKDFGEYVGMAFQIKDDLFDYGDELIEKRQAMILKRKIDLPLIHILQKCSPALKKEICLYC